MAACISGNSITLLGIRCVWSNAGRWRSQKAVTFLSIWITTNDAQTWWGSVLNSPFVEWVCLSRPPEPPKQTLTANLVLALYPMVTRLASSLQPHAKENRWVLRIHIPPKYSLRRFRKV
jgi:hypothetical protein